jgi:hypothetical protein
VTTKFAVTPGFGVGGTLFKPQQLVVLKENLIPLVLRLIRYYQENGKKKEKFFKLVL